MKSATISMPYVYVMINAKNQHPRAIFILNRKVITLLSMFMQYKQPITVVGLVGVCLLN